MPAPEIEIAGRRVGSDHEPFVICELSGNHNGDLDRALAMIDAAAATGCDAIKIQTYTADTITIESDRPEFRIEGGLWDGRTLHDLYQEAQTPYEWHPALFERARRAGVILFSTPFDETAVDLLADLGAPAFKIASFEAIDLPLIRYAASKGRPLIISTGMATLAEIDAAVRVAREAGNDDLVVLCCTTSYPAPPEASNLRTLPVLAAATGTLVGLSDHTLGIGAAVASVALGATVIEKHVTLSRADGGVDSAFSLEPAELAALRTETETAWRALGKVSFGPSSAEAEGLRFRRSLHVVSDVRAGEPVTAENVRSVRPTGGLAPEAITQVLGRPFRTDAAKGTPLTWELL